jgi:methyl-accepting chemotaxis protein
MVAIGYKTLTLPSLGATISAVNTTFANINRPEGAKDGHGKLLPPGTLAVFNKAATKAGDAIVTGQLSLQAIAPSIQETAKSFQTIAPHANGTMDALTGTAGAASQSLTTLSAHINPAIDTANATIGDAGAAIRKLQPVEDDADRMVKDFDARVTSPDVDRFMKGAADSSQQFALTSVQITGIATDVHKQTTAIVAPKPWYVKLGQYGTLGVNIACLATHSCPF